MSRDNVKCPRCGYVMRDVYELFADLGNTSETAYVACEECERTFVVIQTVTITYRAEVCSADR